MDQEGKTIESLLENLKSQDGQVRQGARRDLVARGTEAVDPLTSFLRASSTKQARWEATKALAEIHDPSTGPGLVFSLGAEESDIRWIAAEGLIELQGDGLRLALEGLHDNPGSGDLKLGVHHVVKEFASGDLEKPLNALLASLESSASDDDIPVAVRTALKQLNL